MQVISLVNMKGGVAKTTLATNLADCLVRRHDCRVLLIDTDPQFNATQCLISGDAYFKAIQNNRTTIIDIYDDSSRPTADPVSGNSQKNPTAFKDIVPWNVKEGFDILPGNLELYRLEMSAGQGREFLLKRYLDSVYEDDPYDFVIIDTPPTPSPWMTSALLASDYYIVPVKPEPLSATGVDLLRGVLERISSNFGTDFRCAGVVLTIAERHTVTFKSTVGFLDQNQLWKGKRFSSILPKRVQVARSQGDQQLILDLGANFDDLKRQLSGITKELLHAIDKDDIFG